MTQYSEARKRASTPPGSTKSQGEGMLLGNTVKTLPMSICVLEPCKKNHLVTHISLKEIFKVSNFLALSNSLIST